MQTKGSLRRAIKARLEAQSARERRRKSLLVQKRLFGLGDFKKAACVCFYVSTPLEVDTTSMIDRAIRSGKRVLVPRTNLENKELKLYEITNRRRDLKKGTFGIMEPRPKRSRPADPREVDCILVPGIVFDEKRHRVGHGAGFYDRFLKKLGPRVSKIGLAFSFQVVRKIPTKRHDQRLDFVLTE